MPSLGKDLAEIRKEKGLSLEDINKATKIPIHLLQAIENDTIFDDPSQNATYVRSYIRSFAKQLDIEEELVVRALNQEQQGAYTGLLRDDYEGPRPKFQSRHKEEEFEEVEEDEEETEIEEAESEDVPESRPKVDQPKVDQPKEREAAPPPTQKESSESDTPTIKSVDWVDMGKRFTPLKSRSRMWMGILVLAVIIAIAGVYYFLNQEPGTSVAEPEPREETPSTTAEAVEPDSLQLNLSNPQNQRDTVQNVQTVPAESLSDTLDLVIYAAYDKLEPVRVYTDVVGSLNPYWIELGEGVRFQFVNTIRIRGPYQRMELLLNGHLIENFRQRFINPESGLLEINREVFEGDPKWLQPPPDSLGLSVPDPRVINEQPVFN